MASTSSDRRPSLHGVQVSPASKETYAPSPVPVQMVEGSAGTTARSWTGVVRMWDPTRSQVLPPSTLFRMAPGKEDTPTYTVLGLEGSTSMSAMSWSTLRSCSTLLQLAPPSVVLYSPPLPNWSPPVPAQMVVGSVGS